jgi:tetratricopeptide (TPR) repeat protein
LTSVRAIPFDVDPSALSDVARLLSDPVRRVRLAAVERLVDVPIDSLTDEQRRAFEDAMIEFRESQELSLDQAGGRLALAILARRYGRPGESVEHLRNAIRLQPYLAGPRMELASLLGTAPGNDDEVRRLREEEVELLERDAKLAPTSATIFYHIAKLTYLLGDYDKAQAAIETACRLAPRNFEFLYFRALLHDKRYEISGDEDQFNMGVDAVKKLQDLRPDDPGVREILIMLMEKRRVKEGGDPAAAPQGASAR